MLLKRKRETKQLCECGCRRRVKHEGQRFLRGHHRRLPHGRGVTHSSQPAKVYVMFDGGKEIGSISSLRSDTKPYDTFSSQQEALDWWFKNRKSYMREEGVDHDHPAMRPNIFWELEFGVSYPEDEECISLIESHDLWYPGERDLIIAEGKKIPKISKCRMHAFGYPIYFHEKQYAVVKFIDGELMRGIHPNCKACNLIYAKGKKAKKEMSVDKEQDSRSVMNSNPNRKEIVIC